MDTYRKKNHRLQLCFLKALVVTTLIDAVEDRDIVIFHVPGAFLQASFPEDKFELVKIEEQFVDIMCEVNIEVKKFVRYENGKKVLSLQLRCYQ